MPLAVLHFWELTEEVQLTIKGLIHNPVKLKVIDLVWPASTTLIMLLTARGNISFIILVV